MSPRLGARVAVAGLITLLPAVSWSQGLGAAAEREKARRSGKGTPKVYGDDDLKTNPGQIANADGSQSTTNPPEPDEKNVAGSALARPAANAEAAARERIKAQWRERAAGRHRAVEAAEQRVKQLEEELERAEAEKRLAPYPRSSLYNRATALLKRLDLARVELANARKAVEDLEDEARRAGALPGWLR